MGIFTFGGVRAIPSALSRNRLGMWPFDATTIAGSKAISSPEKRLPTLFECGLLPSGNALGSEPLSTFLELYTGRFPSLLRNRSGPKSRKRQKTACS